MTKLLLGIATLLLASNIVAQNASPAEDTWLCSGQSNMAYDIDRALAALLLSLPVTRESDDRSSVHLGLHYHQIHGVVGLG